VCQPHNSELDAADGGRVFVGLVFGADDGWLAIPEGEPTFLVERSAISPQHQDTEQEEDVTLRREVVIYEVEAREVHGRVADVAAKQDDA
jgi:hypothetical protein